MNPFFGYPLTVYQDFEKAVGGSVPHFEKLLKGGYPQWAAFSNGILGDSNAVIWLLNNGYGEMAVVANGIDDEPYALRWLRANPDPFYYAFCQACKNDENALEWLDKNNLPAFHILARAIYKAMRMRIKRETFWYKIDW